jgi:hypothetical protein
VSDLEVAEKEEGCRVDECIVPERGRVGRMSPARGLIGATSPGIGDGVEIDPSCVEELIDGWDISKISI